MWYIIHSNLILYVQSSTYLHGLNGYKYIILNLGLEAGQKKNIQTFNRHPYHPKDDF